MKCFSPLVLSVLLARQHVLGEQQQQERQLDAGFQIVVPTDAPSETPSDSPTIAPTRPPTRSPTRHPTREPTRPPTFSDAGQPVGDIPDSMIAPLCGSQTDQYGEPISNSTAYEKYNFEALGWGGDYFSRGYVSNRVAFYLSKACRYHMRDQEYNVYDVSGVNEWFKAAALLMDGEEIVGDEVDPPRFTGFGSPWKNDVVKDYKPCASGMFCTAVKVNEANPILTGTKVFQFSSQFKRDEMYRFFIDTINDGDRYHIYGTNSHLKCGSPPFCASPGRGRLGKTCYVDPVGWYQPTEQCEDYKFMIDYALGAEPAESVSGTKDVWPWFNECCASFKCKRVFQRGSFPYGDIWTEIKQHRNATWYFRISGSGSDIRWNCENKLEAELMQDFARSVQASKLTHHKDKGESCQPPPEIPPIILEPTPAPTYAPGVDCTDDMKSFEPKPATIAGRNVDQRRSFGYCFGKGAKAYIGPGQCGELQFYLEGSKTDYTTGDDIFEWFDASIETMFGCKMENPADKDRFTYVGRPNYGVDSRVENGERKYWFFMSNNTHTVNGQRLHTITGTGSRIRWECPSGAAAYDAQSHFWTTTTRNSGSGNEFGDFWAVKPGDCTAEPSAAPVVTTSPTITASPTGTPTMFPTYCQESYLDSEKLNIALVVDLSFSTYKYNFSGSDIGDVNGDGKKQTILDAEVMAIQELLDAISESDTLNNGNTEIALISFHTDAKLEGVYPPLGSDGNANQALMDYIKANLRTETSEAEIMNTNNGYTNFDAALDEAVDYFQNKATPDRLNLLVFMSDGVPNVRGDGDAETFCADKVTFWNEVEDIEYVCSETGIEPGAPLDFCLANDSDCVRNNKYQDCVRGPNFCDNSPAATQYTSELNSLDDMGVARLAIGIGADSNVAEGSALWMIDDNPGKYVGVLPTRVMSTDELSRAVSNLCILNTANPTPAPSDAPSSVPTDTLAPSSVPTSQIIPLLERRSFPSQCPTDIVEVKTVGPAGLPVDHIKIVSQDTSSVTVELHQTWKTTTIEKIWYYYSTDAFNKNCYAEEVVPNGNYETITLDCTGSSHTATLHIWVSDPMFAGYDAAIPQCCYKTPEDTSPTVEHVVSIACKSTCPVETA